jgi:hypothetical protein
VQQESIVRQLYIQRQLPFLEQQSKTEMRLVERLSCLPHVAWHGRTGGKARKDERSRHTNLGMSKESAEHAIRHVVVSNRAGHAHEKYAPRHYRTRGCNGFVEAC